MGGKCLFQLKLPRYSSSLWGSLGSNLKQLVTPHPQSKAEKKEYMHDLLIMLIWVSPLLHSSELLPRDDATHSGEPSHVN